MTDHQGKAVDIHLAPVTGALKASVTALELVYRVFPLTGQWSDLFVMGLCVLLTILVSWAVFVVVEKRMINFAKRLTAASKPLRPEMVI